MGGNKTVRDFDAAKKDLKQVYHNREITFHCDCPYIKNNPLLSKCGYIPIEDPKRANRIEWEHIVPASQFGRTFVAWREGHKDCVKKKTNKPYRGRECARHVSQEFRRMEADLFNLVPAIGEVNAMRGNLPFGILTGTEAFHEICEMKFSKTQVEPPPKMRGFIARTYLHMDATYPGRDIVSSENKDRLVRWHEEFPPTETEAERARRIEQTMGYRHVYF
jgi:deoxyribonuclease-1